VQGQEGNPVITQAWPNGTQKEVSTDASWLQTGPQQHVVAGEASSSAA